MHRLRTLVATSASRRYEVTAFSIGFALMAYELTASRILAPSIGSSTYVWTSVIGVIIAALAVGYAAGGILADRRVMVSDIAWLLLASAFGVAATLLLADNVLRYIVAWVHDPRLQGLLAATLLFLPASFALGMISPYLARLRNVSLATTGRAVASLSALNSLGGIFGTFCVGFLFFGFLGSKQTLLLIGLQLMATSWLLAPREHWRQRVLACGLILILILLQSLTPLPHTLLADIDTTSAHYQVADGIYRGHPTRLLLTGPHGAQSGVWLGHPEQLVFPYTQEMARIIATQPHHNRLLILGGGAFTLPYYLGHTYPQAQVDVAEIDPQLPGIARRYFGYKDLPNVHIATEDARTFLNHASQPYDAIVVDIYNELSLPFSVTTREYVQQLQRVLAPRGLILVNTVANATPSCAPLLSSLDRTYRTAFPQSRLIPLDTADPAALENIVGIYARNSLNFLPSTPVMRTPAQEGQILVDNLAPVERLQQQCRSH